MSFWAQIYVKKSISAKFSRQNSYILLKKIRECSVNMKKYLYLRREYERYDPSVAGNAAGDAYAFV